MQNNTVPTQNDEIDLRELWTTILKRKLTTITFTVLTTAAAAFYAWSAAPVYSGNVLIEVGEVIHTNTNTENTSNAAIVSLDNINNLKEVVTQTTGLSVEIPKGVTNILRISCESSNQQGIKPQLQKAAELIMARHQQKAALYQNNDSKLRMTQIVGDISVGNQPIKPKKQLIVAVGLIAGLILGVFAAFFMEFIQNSKTRREP